jgi:hypothetical protein
LADLIPAQAAAQGEDLEWGRARQGLIPDFRMRLPYPGGLTDNLEELKFIGAGASWFPRGGGREGYRQRSKWSPLMPDSTALRLGEGAGGWPLG